MSNRDTKRWEHFHAAKTERKIRKHVKRNRQPKQPRRNDWQAGDWDASIEEESEYVDLPQRERVMPLGEQERRKAVLAAAAGAPAVERETDAENDEFYPPSWSQGMVVSVSSGLCQVQVDGRSWRCSLRGSLSSQETGYTNLVAVGDRVLVSDAGAGEGVVEEVLLRRSVLARPDVQNSHLGQVIVANADQLLIVAAWRDPAIWLELIDRFIIASERNNLEPIVCVNKIDLCQDRAELHRVLQPYRELGYQVLYTSATAGDGVADLRRALKNKVTALAGLSGVGKSSLLTAVQPGLQLRVGAVNDDRHQGRHTTTQVTLMLLEVGGYVVDTPGIREFGLIGLAAAELEHYYPEIARAGRQCRFADCSHTHEPGCAVKEAAERGEISPERYHSYQVILAELAA